MYRRGNWKLVRQNADNWELYDMSVDKTEMNNLAESQPEKLTEMVEHYEAYKLQIQSP